MTQTRTYTEAEATDEAMLLLFRKTMRMAGREAFDKIWTAMPEGARRAIYAAEARADRLRDAGGRQWAAEPGLDDE